jgi:hypothetical protein
LGRLMSTMQASPGNSDLEDLPEGIRLPANRWG